MGCRCCSITHIRNPHLRAPNLDYILDGLTLVQTGEDYSMLVSHLQSGDFQKADDETRALLIRLAGPDAVKRGWVYFTEVNTQLFARLCS